MEAIHSEAISHKRTWAPKLLEDTEQGKLERYGPGVAPLVVLLRGRMGDRALWTLRCLAEQASAVSGEPAPSFQRRLAHRFMTGLASTEARARIATLGGTMAAPLIANRVLQMPSGSGEN